MNDSLLLSTRSFAEASPMQASKWLKCQMLVDADEMKSLLDTLGKFKIYMPGCVLERGKGLITQEEFLNCYGHYIEELKCGRIPEDADFTSYFSTVFSVTPDSLYAIHIGEDKQIIRAARPVIQLQSHRLDYSPTEHKFRPMILGKDSILWGIQFTYPQLFQDSKTNQVEQVVVGEAFPNTVLFQTLQRWVRSNTVPTPFIVANEKINVPMRLGKQCFSWINAHPQLAKKGLSVLH